MSINPKCVFCKIVKGEDPCTKIYEDDEVMCIQDIRPVATHHYLIIPKIHIQNAKTLRPEDETLYDKVVATVDVIKEKLQVDDTIRTGFHWPPFNTVNHLHLHFISPVENLSLLHRTMFKENSLWFVSSDYVKSRFKEMETPSSSL